MDFKKRTAPVGRREEPHQRLERELTNLMRDRRYWEGDTDYRNYVRRQFERVYNDPSGKPEPLRIGAPKIFATELESFGIEGARLRALKDSQGYESVDSKTKQATSSIPENLESAPTAVRPSTRDIGTSSGMRGGPPSAAQDAGTFARTPPGLEPKISGEIRSGRAIPTDEEPDDLTKTSDFFDALFAGEGTDIQNAQTRSQLLLEIFEDYGWETARRLLLHYMDGTGEPVTVSPEVLGQYPTVRRSYVDVLRYFTEWLVCERSDSKHGTPELPLRDGDKLTIGVPPGHYQKDLDHLIMWEANFSSVAETGHPAALRALGSESHAVFGSAMLQGFANSLVLVREGDLIKITGDMTFRVNDIYDFSEGDMFGLRKLEEAGLARSFGVTTEIWRVEVEGFIKFEDGNPIRAQIHLVDYQDVAGGVDHRPVDFAARRRIR